MPVTAGGLVGVAEARVPGPQRRGKGQPKRWYGIRVEAVVRSNGGVVFKGSACRPDGAEAENSLTVEEAVIRRDGVYSTLDRGLKKAFEDLTGFMKS
jgi:hypothetical protein